MATAVRIPTQLRPLANGASELTVEGSTVGEVLKALDAAHPGFADRLFDDAGNLRRFLTAPQFMAYAGLVPSEYSSGPRPHRGRITKTGNRLLRHVLGEAAHHARHTPNLGDDLKRRQRQQPPVIVEHAWRAQLRLHTRYRQLCARTGPPRALTAIARELAGFIWAAGQIMPQPDATA